MVIVPQQAGSKNHDGAPTSTFTATVPAGTQAGDVLVVAISPDDNAAWSVSPPANTVEIVAPVRATRGSVGLAVYLWTAPATVPASLDFGLSGSFEGSIVWQRFTGVGGLDAAAASALSIYGNDAAAPSITTTTADAFVLGGIAVASGSRTITNPSGWTTAVTETDRHGHLALKGAQASPGSTGTASWGVSGTDVAIIAWQAALAPGESGPPPGAPPVADFTADVTIGTTPLAVQFTDASVGSPASWSWAFGDGATSTSQHPAHTYDEPGVYTVTLSVANADGTDDEVKSGYVTVLEPGAEPETYITGSVLGGTSGSPSSLTVPGLTVTGTTRFVVVGVAINNDNENEVATSVTVGGQAASFVGADVSADDGRLEWWTLAAPPVGTQSVVVNLNTSLADPAHGLFAAAWALDGVDPSGVRDWQITPDQLTGPIGLSVDAQPGDVALLFGYNEDDLVDTGNVRIEPASITQERATAGEDAAVAGHVVATGTSVSASVPISGGDKYIAGALVGAAGSGGEPPPAATPVLTRSWMGVPRADGFRATCKTADAVTVRLVVATDGGLSTGRVISDDVTPDSDGWATATVPTTPDAQWWYGWELVNADGDVTLTDAQGSHDPSASFYRVGFGSCMSTGSTADTLVRMAGKGIGYFFHLGDYDYEDETSTSQAEHLRNMETQLTANSGLRNLVESTPSVYLKSDHDAGGGNNALPGNYTAPNRAAYLQVVPAWQVDPDALYHSFVRGHIRYIFTDDRYLRTTSDYLGAAQMAWFKAEMAQPEPVKVWVQSSTWNSTEPYESPASGGDSWTDYPDDKAELGEYLRDEAVGQVITIHGDQHAISADEGTSGTRNYGIPSWCAAPFDRTASHKGGPWSEGRYPTSTGATVQQYGVIDVDEQDEQVVLTFRGYDSGDTVRVSHTITVPLVPDTPWHLWDGTDLIPLTFAGIADGAGSITPGTLEVAP